MTTEIEIIEPGQDVPLDELTKRIRHRLGVANKSAVNAIEGWWEVGDQLKEVRDVHLKKSRHDKGKMGFAKWLEIENEKEHLIGRTQAYALIKLREQNPDLSLLVHSVNTLITEGKPPSLKQLIGSNGKKKPADVEPFEDAAPPPGAIPITTKNGYITKSMWDDLPESQQTLESIYATAAASSRVTSFNPQKNRDIEWAQYSWNPVTGCLHDCPYCYARDIANNIYEQKFVPTIIPERLNGPQNTKPDDRAKKDVAFKNVFTCSMADLFGKWVPTPWIEAVLQTIADNSQWNFLFLTKFPKRLAQFEYPDNAWIGTTVDAQARVKNAEDAFSRVKAKVKWLSCEPLLEPLEFEDLSIFSWIVIGGSSKSSETPEWRPPKSWVEDLRYEAREAGLQIYEKTNLLYRERAFPGHPDPEPELPDTFKYLAGMQ